MKALLIILTLGLYSCTAPTNIPISWGDQVKLEGCEEGYILQTYVDPFSLEYCSRHEVDVYCTETKKELRASICAITVTDEFLNHGSYDDSFNL